MNHLYPSDYGGFALTKIREYESSDLENCRRLWAEMTQQHRDIYDDPSIGGEEPGLEFDQHLEKIGGKRVWVAVLEDMVVGFASLIQDGEQAEIEPIAVLAEHRGQQIGQKLLQHVTQEAKNAGVLCLGMKPVARNEDAIRFFYEAGFRTIGHIHLFKWLGEPLPGQWKPGPEIFGKKFEY